MSHRVVRNRFWPTTAFPDPRTPAVDRRNPWHGSVAGGVACLFGRWKGEHRWPRRAAGRGPARQAMPGWLSRWSAVSRWPSTAERWMTARSAAPRGAGCSHCWSSIVATACRRTGLSTPCGRRSRRHGPPRMWRRWSAAFVVRWARRSSVACAAVTGWVTALESGWTSTPPTNWQPGLRTACGPRPRFPWPRPARRSIWPGPATCWRVSPTPSGCTSRGCGWPGCCGALG